MRTVRIVKHVRSLPDGRRIFARRGTRPMRRTCEVVDELPQHVILRAPDGIELWAQRCDGKLTGAKGGRGGGSRALPPQWDGWMVDLEASGLAWFYVETPNR